ncbi:nucleotide exchange factor GrpE [Candidatus Babeliales bacterium]|nr:nucleotide exchange factor GrpE [Candidatus Babeliales bacterium]
MEKKDQTTNAINSEINVQGECYESCNECSQDLCADELQNCQASLLRVTADLQNLKRRTEKERAEWGMMGQMAILNVFLPLIDDVDLALSVADVSVTEDSDKEWLEGFKLIQKKLNKIFDDLGVKEIDCGAKFDPKLHEALVSVESEEHEEGDVVEILRKGYTFKDKVIRHARVSVCK